MTETLLAWRAYLSAIVADTVGEVAAQLGGHKAPLFEAASYLQLNNYAEADSDRDLLQDKHEDGHLVTVIHTTAPGLELWLDGEACPVETATDEVLLMPGSVFADLTGGRIPALYHQVRNLYISNRTALMYFVTPELAEPIYRLDHRAGHDPDGPAREDPQQPLDVRTPGRSGPLTTSRVPLRPPRRSGGRKEVSGLP
ncbi:2OG-Fe(II) oxygenase family protein [Streptomyces sp. NPDC002573]|uniref:2OG-Fe(II) oxygenase family protein n=1 Tax=Streptomyces sp. NPDC002573 TaxID=3364651 RepID=UPI0036B46066